VKELTQAIKGNIYSVAVFLLALSVVLPSIFSMQASASALVTSRSIKMTSSAAGASSQTYEISFTTATASNIQGVVVDFCTESPILGSSACTQPTSMTVGSGTVTQTGLNAGTWTAATLQSGKTLEVYNTGATTSVNSGTVVTISLGNFTNPSTVGSFYARVFTYATKAAADGYTSANPSAGGAYVDAGGVALSTTNAISVSATVQETLTFCVSGASPTTGCGGTTLPTIVLGHGSPVTLGFTQVDTADVYYQASSNGSGGTAINIKGTSPNLTNGSNTIPSIGSTPTHIPSNTTSDATTTGGFGAHQAAVSSALGSLTSSASFAGTTTDYGMDSNVSSTYGALLASTLPASALVDTTMKLTFAAAAGTATPAGIYTASYALIATSTY
jgi:hypothetical protein